MAKNNSILKFKGTLGKLCFYTLNGKEIVRTASGPSASRIKHDPAFANVKKNNHEFAGATYISKAIRQGWSVTGKQFQDTYMASRLTGQCRRIIAKGVGKLGQREGNLQVNGQSLVGFQLHQEKPFTHSYSGEFQVSHTPNREQITLSNYKLSSKQLKNRPNSATHIQFTGLLGTVSTYQWSEPLEQYQPQNTAQNGIATVQTTNWLSMQQLPNTVEILLNTPNQIIPAQDTAILINLGITYGVQENNAIQPLKTAQAMQIVAVL